MSKISKENSDTIAEIFSELDREGKTSKSTQTNYEYLLEKLGNYMGEKSMRNASRPESETPIAMMNMSILFLKVVSI